MKMKKLISLVLAFTVCLAFAGFYTNDAYAGDGFSTATQLPISHTITKGTFNGNAHYFTVSTSEEFQISAVMYTHKAGDTISLYDANHNLLKTNTTASSGVAGVSIGYLLGGMYYIVITGSSGNFSLDSCCNFRNITYTETQSSRYDNFDNAKELNLGSKDEYTGLVGINDNQDSFYINTPCSGTITLSRLISDGTGNYTDLNAAFYSTSKSYISGCSLSMNPSGASSILYNGCQAHVSGGKNYLLMKGSNLFYAVNTSFIPDAPTGIKQVDQTARTVTLEWVPNNGADGYEIVNSGNVVASVSGGSTSKYTINNLNPGTSYIFSIKTVAKVNGEEIRSTPSKTVIAFTPMDKLTIKKLVSGKKSFTIKVPQRYGSIYKYEVRYSMKSSMEQSKSCIVNSFTSKTIKKLKAKKKYYVQVRIISVYNGNYYYSDWSNKKSVTTK